MRTECTQITAPLLFLSVLAPPGLGVVCVAVRLEDDEQVVDEVLLLVRGAQRVALLVRLEVTAPAEEGARRAEHAARRRGRREGRGRRRGLRRGPGDGVRLLPSSPYPPARA